jgi:peptidoglycan/xylan/chitin deacetylase (PgdA/CDA1 family)
MRGSSFALSTVLLTGLLVGSAGCGGTSVFKQQAQKAVVVPERVLSRPIDAEMLRFRLTAQQPEWPTGRLPAAPGFRSIDCARVKCIALTFDDGPGDFGDKVLDALAKHEARATFFLIGQSIIPKTRPYLSRIISQGHEIGNHTWDHAELTRLSEAKLKDELTRTSEVITAFTGVRPKVLRPPYGLTNGRVSGEAKRQGLAQIMWTVDTNDWKDHDTALVAKRAETAAPGSIVLMHEIQKTTVAAVPQILDYLDRKGFTYVTISELFGQHYLTAGQQYTKR